MRRRADADGSGTGRASAFYGAGRQLALRHVAAWWSWIYRAGTGLGCGRGLAVPAVRPGGGAVVTAVWATIRAARSRTGMLDRWEARRRMPKASSGLQCCWAMMM